VRPEAGLISRHIETLVRFNDTPGEGISRMSFTEQDRGAREYLFKEMRNLELAVRFDGAGNIYGLLAGKVPEKPRLMTRSHIDTVYHGGKYVGVVGTVCALEHLRLIRESGMCPDRSLERVVFSEEEGPNFGSSLAGGKAMNGAYTE